MLGCLVMLVAVPIALITGLIVLLGSVLGRLLGGGRRRTPQPAAGEGFQAQDGPFRTAGSSSAPAASGGSEREAALCAFVRGMALDDTFTRDEASQAAVISVDGAGATDYLADASARGWIEPRGDGLSVTARGREAASAYLQARGL